MITVYHGSHDKILGINFDKCHLGWHAGTLCLALDLADPDRNDSVFDWDNCYIYVSKINPTKKNTIVIDDIFMYGNDFEQNIIRILKANIKIQHPKNSCYFDLDKCETLEDIRLTLLNNGFLYIAYNNRYETKGISYCILNEDIEILEYTFYDFLTNHLMFKYKTNNE